MGEINEMVNESLQSKKHFSMLGIMFLLGTFIIYVVQAGAQILVSQLKPEWMENPNISLTVAMVPLYLIGMPILILLVKRIPITAIEKRSMKIWQFLLAIIMCFSLMYCSNIVGLCITAIIGLLKGSFVSNVILDVTANTSLLINFLYMVICAPIMEEYIFRKLIVDRTVRYGQGVAVLLSGLMFGLFHGNLNQFAYAFSIGMFFAFLYVKTGNIKYTIGIHMIVNFCGSIIVTLLMKAINFDRYMEVINSGAGQEELMEVVMASLPGWIAYMCYIMLMLAIIIAGIVLFIVFRKRFVMEKGEVQIEKGKRFSTVIMNAGMLVFCLFWITEIILQLFDLSFVTIILSKIMG